MELVYTVGHSTWTLETFLELLREHGIRQLVDVRRFPASRRHPHFAREPLVQALSAAGIEYVHEPALGGWRSPPTRLAQHRLAPEELPGLRRPHGYAGIPRRA